MSIQHIDCRLGVRTVLGIAAAISCMLPGELVIAAEPFRLDLTDKLPPATIEDERRQRFEQHYDCLAGRGDATTCERLEQEAQQSQADAVRKSASPAPIPAPIVPDNRRRESMPLPGGR